MATVTSWLLHAKFSHQFYLDDIAALLQRSEN